MLNHDTSRLIATPLVYGSHVDLTRTSLFLLNAACTNVLTVFLCVCTLYFELRSCFKLQETKTAKNTDTSNFNIKIRSRARSWNASQTEFNHFTRIPIHAVFKPLFIVRTPQ